MATKSQAVTICWKQKDHKNLPHYNRPSFQGFSMQNQKEFETFKFKQKEIFPNRQPRWQFWYGNVVRMTENKFPSSITSLWNPNQFQPCSSCENNSENLQIQRDRKRQKKKQQFSLHLVPYKLQTFAPNTYIPNKHLLRRVNFGHRALCHRRHHTLTTKCLSR